MPGSKHRSDLAYTEAVLHESMRLATVAPTGVPHVTTCDTSVGKRYTSRLIREPYSYIVKLGFTGKIIPLFSSC